MECSKYVVKAFWQIGINAQKTAFILSVAKNHRKRGPDMSSGAKSLFPPLASALKKAIPNASVRAPYEVYFAGVKSDEMLKSLVCMLDDIDSYKTILKEHHIGEFQKSLKVLCFTRNVMTYTHFQPGICRKRWPIQQEE